MAQIFPILLGSPVKGPLRIGVLRGHLSLDSHLIYIYIYNHVAQMGVAINVGPQNKAKYVVPVIRTPKTGSLMLGYSQIELNEFWPGLG